MNSTIPIRPLAMVKLLTLATLALALVLLSGCRLAGVKGNGDIKTETRPIGDFTTLEATGAYEVTWTHGAPALQITADSNLLKHIETDVDGKKLDIEWEKQLRPTRKIKVRISSSELVGAELNGAVRLNAADMRTSNFVLEANGATRVELKGTLDGLAASMNGASRLDAEELRARVAELSINGAGRADVNASELLRVAVSGAGRVNYVGNPRVQKEISGAGRVRRRD
jgi:hypothetical protein